MQIDVLCLQETHIPWNNRGWLKDLGLDLLANSRQGTTTRGVAILARHGVLISKRTKEDNLGRWVIVEAVIKGTLFTICSLYGSNLDDPEVLNFFNIELALWPSPLVLCGDFNIHLSSSFNLLSNSPYLGRKSKTFRALQGLIREHGLADIWYRHRQAEPGFTYFSAPHNKFVRLDYFFMSNQTAEKVNIELFPRIIDHNPLVV